ncbi:MAG: ABC transporter substrate-binding protein [Deltaproteobacteria bacterium]|nr:ABC transporter substrate-binding protein [Deltaproteobacteria bacterium]
MIKLKKKEKLDTKEKLKIYGPAVLFAIIGVVFAYQFVDPAPPRRISIGTGSPEDATFTYGKAYSKLLAKDGVTLEVRSTAGSAENIKLLEADSGGVDVAIVQGGMAPLAHKNDLKLNRIPDLKGLRVAVGVKGSGTRILAMQLLGLNGISEKNTQIFPYGHEKAADLLLSGEIDAAMFVSTHRSPYVLRLIDSRSVALMGLERAEAYALFYHYLYILKVPEGIINFEANIPSRDLTLVAPTTQLLARKDLHPALISLILQAAEEVHETGSEFERQGQFPSPEYIEFKLSEEAERFYESGPPFLQRYLPFWLANFMTRMRIMLLPLFVLLFPLFKLMPPIYRWRMRKRIYRWYSELAIVDPEMHKEDLTANLDEYLLMLDNLEKKVTNISVPPAYSEELYSLRLHIDMLRNKLYRAHEKENRTK